MANVPNSTADYSDGHKPGLRLIGAGAPFDWVHRGLQDFLASPMLGAAYGLAFALIGAVMAYVSINQPQFTLLFVFLFILTGPFLATSLYNAAQLHARGEHVTSGATLRPMWNRRSHLAVYIGIMLVFTIAWIRITALVIALSFGMMPAEFSLNALATGSAHGAYLSGLLGVSVFLYALMVFALSAVSLPMISEGRADAVSAMLFSVRTVFSMPGTMLTWAAIIAGLTLLGLSTLLIALVFVFPILGYATWHSYRDLVE